MKRINLGISSKLILYKNYYIYIYIKEQKLLEVFIREVRALN